MILALALVALTSAGTIGGVLYVLQLDTADAVSMLKMYRAMQIVKHKYVEEVPNDVLVSGAIKGMVAALGDPHSTYMDAKTYKEFKIGTEGSFGGVGIVVGMKDKQLTVISPIEGTPGEKAGIRSGDLILKIDGKETKEMPLDEAVGKIRGPEGTQVVLTLRRGAEEAKEVALTRSNIQIQTVQGKLLPENIGYIRISMFNENTGTDFIRKLQELEGQGMKALVLDLRNNPGGLLEESVKVAGKMVPKGPVVSVVTKDGKREVHESQLAAVKYPQVVLVNGGSASAAEIVAGAVQDTQSGVLVGGKTFGKGSVQTVMKLNDGAIKITMAKYLTPGERWINGTGIEPDVTVPFDGEKGTGPDVQLDKALEVIKSKW